MKTLKFFISGNVQGVFFRKFIEDKANELGLKGFARNLNDGRVEVVVEGKDENVNKIIEICRKGSPHSEVKNVEVEEIKHQGFSGFKILKGF
jgi:acylphosphatase